MTSMQESVVLSRSAINQPEDVIVSLRVMIERTEICGRSTIGGNLYEWWKPDFEIGGSNAYATHMIF